MKEVILNTVLKASKNYMKYKAIVDDDDYAEVIKHNWCISNGYAITKINGYTVRLQRFICKLHNIKSQTVRVYHGNSIKLDCRKNTLVQYDSKQRERSRNGRIIFPCRVRKSVAKSKSSKYIGVCFEKDRGKWAANISINSVNIRLGRFATEKQAAEAYNEAKQKIESKRMFVLNKIEYSPIETEKGILN